jgi:DNA-binding NarL/FixJ family response regulator
MGRTYISPAISGKVVEGYLEGKKETETQSLLDTLTRREREILKLVAEGYKNKDIADLLCISVATISKHRDNIMKKLDLHSAAALTAYAIETGVVII